MFYCMLQSEILQQCKCSALLSSLHWSSISMNSESFFTTRNLNTLELNHDLNNEKEAIQCIVITYFLRFTCILKIRTQKEMKIIYRL